MQVQTGERPYKFDQYDKAFTQCASLKKTYKDTCRKNVYSAITCVDILNYLYLEPMLLTIDF